MSLDKVLPMLGLTGVVAPYGINAAFRNRPAVRLPLSPLPCFPFFIPAKILA